MHAICQPVRTMAFFADLLTRLKHKWWFQDRWFIEGFVDNLIVKGFF